MTMTLDDILGAAPVIPVIVIDDPERAVALGQALVAGGLRVLEVTLRTPGALAALRHMADIPGAIVGAGTVIDPAQFDEVVAAGAKFAVSPGFTPSLAAAARSLGLPWLPGAATATEVMTARAADLRCLKFFPAESSGGIAQLKSFASVFQDIRFCPTGGIGASQAASYLALPNVACVGGSWPVPADAVAQGDWTRIRDLAAACMQLRPAAAPAGRH